MFISLNLKSARLKNSCKILQLEKSCRILFLNFRFLIFLTIQNTAPIINIVSAFHKIQKVLVSEESLLEEKQKCFSDGSLNIFFEKN